MASLKALLKSTLTAWRGSHKSVPASDWIVVDMSVTSSAENLYTAPCDGFFVVQPESPSHSLRIRKRGMDWVSGPATEGPWYAWSIPCQKGDQCVFIIESPNPSLTAHIRFYPMVGEQA